MTDDRGPTLIIGGTGKTGRRVADRLAARGVEARVASRSGETRFDWDDSSTWGAAMDGVSAAYVTYFPDLAVPEAPPAIEEFSRRAAERGIQRLVLLSGRGEVEAQRCERIILETNPAWTIVRASWFNQNFSEGEFLEMVLNGSITLPAADIPEPFVDANDIADVAVAALTEVGHACEFYEVTGPRLLTFSEVAREISLAAGRDVRYIQIPIKAFTAAIAGSGAPANIQWLLGYLFDTALDGRNVFLGDGVQRALEREPTDFVDYARCTAALGTWDTAGDASAA